MKPILSMTPAILILSALPAVALDLGNGWTADGEFELEYYDSSVAPGEFLGYGTADIGFNQTGGGFGGFVGFDAFSVDGTQEIAGYAALSFSGDFGRIQLGVPRSVVSDYVDAPVLGGFRIYDLTFLRISDSFLTSAYLIEDTDTPVGLRYDGSFGDLKLGSSYHKVEDADILAIAANYQLGATKLSGAIEYLRDGGFDGTSYHLGAESAFGPVTAGLQYSNAEDVSDASLLQLYATYSPMDRLDLTGAIWNGDSASGNQTLYGISAEYGVTEDAYIQAGIADGEDISTAYNLSLGIKF